jgi:RNA polymerase sigma-70 factor, ECF subfamily
MARPKPPQDVTVLPMASHEPGQRLVSLRDVMLRFARLQLRDEATAEDAVQEALASAWGGLGEFRNEAELKTWVFAILRNKIIDSLRARSRKPEQIAQVIDVDYRDDDFFDEQGNWREETRPSDWGDPEVAFCAKQFWAVLELCLTRLPENAARVFTMREILGLSTDEICAILGIKSKNCWVVLHRARMRLRLCLEERWFDGKVTDHAL